MNNQIDLSKSVIFPIGKKNDTFAQYFIGQSYLNMLSSWFVHLAVEVPSEGGSNEWLKPVDNEHYRVLD